VLRDAHVTVVQTADLRGDGDYGSLAARFEAQVNYRAGNTGSSTKRPVSVTGVSSWSLVAAEQLASDPINGDALDQLGDVTAALPLNLDQSGGTQDGGAALVYKSDSAFNYPVIEALIDTSNSAALPSYITAVLTWDGSPSRTIVYHTDNVAAGDEIALNVYPGGTPPTGMGHHSWGLTIEATGLGSLGASGTAYAASQDYSPFGAGWAYGPTDQLVSIPYDAYGPAGMLRVFGTGEWSFYEGTGTFTSPGDDFGTLATSGSGYTYTSPDGEVESYNSAGYETQWTSADGQETLQYRYGTISGVTVLTGTTAIDGALATFSYGTGVYGPLLSTIQTVNGRTYTFANDGVGLTSVTNPDGQQDVVSGDGYDGHLSYQAWGVETNEFAYNGDSGSVVTAMWGDADGSPTAMLPVAVQGVTGLAEAVKAPVLASQTNAVGDTTKWLLDFQGRPLNQYDGDGGVYTFMRDAVTHLVTEQIDPLGRITQYAYDTAGYVTQETMPDGTTLQWQYQSLDHLVTKQTDQLGHNTTMAYDSGGHLTSTTDPLTNVTAYAYNASGLMTSMTDARGNTTDYAYDSYRRLTATTDALGNTTTQSYDANGFPLTTTDALNHLTTATYDVMGRLSYVTDPLGGVTSMTYYFEGLLATQEDALGRVSGIYYGTDDRGLVEEQWYAEGDTLYGYDAAGRLDAMRDPTGSWTSYLLDSMGRTTETIDALGGVSLAVYDLDGEMSASRDPLGNWTYDAAGQTSTITDADGREQVFHYDSDGRTTAETWLASGATVNLLTYTYDNNGNQLTASDYSGTYSNSYDAQDRLTAQTDPLGLTLTYSYDASGDVTQRADSLGGVLTYQYDNAGRLAAEQFGGTGMTQAGVSLGYDAANELTSVTRYSDAALTTLVGTTVYAYDAADRMTAITNKNASAATLSYYQYTYNAADLVTTQTWQSQSTTGVLISGAYTYSYDSTHQLLSDGTTTYSYDANGNPTMSGYATGSDNQVTNDGTWTYTYDNVGDIIEKSKGSSLETWYYTYDTLNRLVSIEQTTNGTTAEYTVTYTYDVYGNLMKEQQWQSGGSTTTTYSAYDNGQVWADLNSSLSATTRYIWGGPGSSQLYDRIDVGVGLRQVSQDALGSVRDVWDTTGVLDHLNYTAFGFITSETSWTLGGYILYDGLREDRASGTVMTEWRTLQTSLQRWMQTDPSGFGGGDDNLYRDCGNDPTNGTDRTGLSYINYYPPPRPADQTLAILYFEPSGLFGSEAYIGVLNPKTQQVRRGIYSAFLSDIRLEVANSYSPDWDNWFKEHDLSALPPGTVAPPENSTLIEAWKDADPQFRRDWKEGLARITWLANGAVIWSTLGPSFVTQSGKTLVLRSGQWFRAGTGAPATAAEESAADAAIAVTQKGLDPNKLNHIFGNPGHNLGALVTYFKTEGTALQAIQQATDAVVTAKGITGVFQETVTVGGQTITVRGTVIGGVAKIGTAFK